MYASPTSYAFHLSKFISFDHINLKYFYFRVSEDTLRLDYMEIRESVIKSHRFLLNTQRLKSSNTKLSELCILTLCAYYVNSCHIHFYSPQELQKKRLRKRRYLNEILMPKY